MAAAAATSPALIVQRLAAVLLQIYLLAIIFTESTSIGARTYEVTKHMLQRVTQIVDTPFGPVRIKLAQLNDQVVNIAPEYEDCRQLARRHNVPVKAVYDAARTSFLPRSQTLFGDKPASETQFPEADKQGS